MAHSLKAAMGHKPGIEMVFGVGGGKAPKGDDEHGEATSNLKDALVDAGLDEGAMDTVMDALDQYVDACVKKHMEGGSAPKDEEEEGY